MSIRNVYEHFVSSILIPNMQMLFIILIMNFICSYSRRRLSWISSLCFRFPFFSLALPHVVRTNLVVVFFVSWSSHARFVVHSFRSLYANVNMLFWLIHICFEIHGMRNISYCWKNHNFLVQVFHQLRAIAQSCVYSIWIFLEQIKYWTEKCVY